MLQYPEGHPSDSGTRYQQPYVVISKILRCILHGIHLHYSLSPTQSTWYRQFHRHNAQSRPCPSQPLRDPEPMLGRYSSGVKGHMRITDNNVDDLSKETALLRITLVVQIIEMVTTLTPTLGGREVWRAALSSGSDAVGVVLATCDRAGKSELVCSALDGLKEPKPIPPSDSGIAENPTDPSMTPYSLLDLGSGSSLDHLRNGAGAVPAKPTSMMSAEASGTEVNGGATVAVPAEESATSDELASQTYRGDGRQEGEKRQRWWPERKEPSSPAVVEVGGDGGCRKQIVLLSGHVNPSSAPVQMEEGHVNLGYGGPRSPAMDMGDAGSSLFSDVQPYSQL
ncbi:hypothetical protein BKA70DRAFT_1242973 [Coprinopsis sp. MPI-PUGE-AT-0042]|nr:hypothetical protein BKA70DRAFT_1242973 [Coprinopsis sp. MPI-PUGE-AT-0042]